MVLTGIRAGGCTPSRPRQSRWDVTLVLVGQRGPVVVAPAASVSLCAGWFRPQQPPTMPPCLATSARVPGFGPASASYPLPGHELPNPRGFRWCQTFILFTTFLLGKDWEGRAPPCCTSPLHPRKCPDPGCGTPSKRLIMSQGSWAGCCLPPPGLRRVTWGPSQHGFQGGWMEILFLWLSLKSHTDLPGFRGRNRRPSYSLEGASESPCRRAWGDLAAAGLGKHHLPLSLTKPHPRPRPGAGLFAGLLGDPAPSQ